MKLDDEFGTQDAGKQSVRAQGRAENAHEAALRVARNVETLMQDPALIRVLTKWRCLDARGRELMARHAECIPCAEVPHG